MAVTAGSQHYRLTAQGDTISDRIKIREIVAVSVGGTGDVRVQDTNSKVLYAKDAMVDGERARSEPCGWTNGVVATALPANVELFVYFE